MEWLNWLNIAEDRRIHLMVFYDMLEIDILHLLLQSLTRLEICQPYDKVLDNA